MQALVDAPVVSGDSTPSRSLFWRKVSNVEDLCDGLAKLPGAGLQPAAKVRVVEDKNLSQSDYDKFTADFFASQPWLDGKGGIDEDGTRHVIQVTAQDRQTLHIDPQGHDYARYVGIPESDVQRVMGSRSLVVAGMHSTQTLQPAAPSADLPQLPADARSQEPMHGPGGSSAIPEQVAEKSPRAAPQRQSTRRSAGRGR